MVKTKVTEPQKYILIDEEYVSQVFTDASTKGILDVSNDVFDELETVERLKEGKMKLFKIEEVKVEVTEPSIKIVG